MDYWWALSAESAHGPILPAKGRCWSASLTASERFGPPCLHSSVSIQPHSTKGSQSCSPPMLSRHCRRSHGKQNKQVKNMPVEKNKEREIMCGHSPSHLQIAFTQKHQQTYSVPSVSATPGSPSVLSVLTAATFSFRLFSYHFRYFFCHQGFLKTTLFLELGFLHTFATCLYVEC